MVLTRTGPTAAVQALMTLESLIDRWATVPDWSVVLVGPRDAAVGELVRSLSGDLSVVWDCADVAGLVAERRAVGEDVRVFHAGDGVPPEPGAPMRVPLVDVQGVAADGTANASLSSLHPDSDGLGLLTWERDVDPGVRHPLVVFTNLSLNEAPRYRAARKVAWLVESPEVHPETTEAVLRDSSQFDLVITTDADVAAALPRAAVVPPGGCFIPPADQKVTQKTRNVSMIASRKAFTTGHRVRHAVVELLPPGRVDLFGRGFDGLAGFREVDNKAEALAPYRFSITIENSWRDPYFSEKLIDCFRCGTIPIYWGSRRVVDHFDDRGILFMEDPTDIAALLDAATPEAYADRLDAVAENYFRAAGWRAVEDRLYPLLAPLVDSTVDARQVVLPGPRRAAAAMAGLR